MLFYYLSPWINTIFHTYQTFLSSTFLWPSLLLSPGSMNFTVRNIFLKKSKNKIHFKISRTAETIEFFLYGQSIKNKCRVKRKEKKKYRSWWPYIQHNVKKNWPVLLLYVYLWMLKKWQIYSKINPKLCWKNKGRCYQQMEINSREMYLPMRGKEGPYGDAFWRFWKIPGWAEPADPAMQPYGG